ncbi:MAG: family 78 glycoside hydrolase catalytic domain [Acidobacteriota bacterium]|nr:family 78 glycoside hydrolase catalytic domain [Acidobacteriota bacterium]
MARPRLSWLLEAEKAGARGLSQTAYQVLVATSPEKLRAQDGDLWNSGKVDSGNSIQVEYAGKALASRTHCWWKVRAWDQSGTPSAWSEPGTWSMGIRHASDWDGHWIGGSTGADDASAIYLRRVTRLAQRPVRATAYVCGLGYYQLNVNGKRVGDHVLDPTFTNYDRRVLYVTYDVTSLLRAGQNAVGVILGNGWYHAITPDLFGFEKAPWRKPPKLLINIDVDFPDGTRQTIASDSSWKWSTGPIVFNCIRSGITDDARARMPGWSEPHYSDSAWRPVAQVDAPRGELKAQMQPPMRVTETVHPVKITEPKPHVYLFDLGTDLTGWVKFEAHGEPGQKIDLQYNLMLKPDGTLDTKYCHSHTYGRFQTDELILDQHGKGVIEPEFTYHGFRYVEVAGLNYKPSLENLTGFNVHTDWQSAGTFSCSNPKINRMQDAIRRTLSESNHSIPGEEPTREKMGWTQDGLNSMEAALYNYDAAAVYRNYMFDMIDAQEANGHVPPIIPTDGWGLTKPGGAPHDFSDPWWGGTLPYVAWKLYDYYGDRRALEEAYVPMKRWVDYLGTTAKDHLVNWGLGDWLEVRVDVHRRLTPKVITSTAGYYYCANAVARAAELLGQSGDAQTYAQLAGEIKSSFNEHFFNPATGQYAPSTQASLALPLYLDMVPGGQRQLVLQNLIEDIHAHKDHLTTGFVGVMPMLHGLADWGYPGLAYTVAMQEDVPGFLPMVAHGEKTMGESVESDIGTRLHPFGTCIGSFLYQDIAGIHPDRSAPGFRHIIIRPVLGNLTWAKARYDSINGPIAVAWQRNSSSFTLHVSIPPNTTATVDLPAKSEQSVTERGKPLLHAPGVKVLQGETTQVKVNIGSGEYDFRILM